jgi:hypothetical protein
MGAGRSPTLCPSFRLSLPIGASTGALRDVRFASIVLKNSEIERPRKSRFRARRVMSADSTSAFIRCTSRLATASAPIRLIGVRPRVARTGATTTKASWDRVRRCQPNAAPFFLATLRASSLAASSAPTISTSSSTALLSSQSSARQSRRWLAQEMWAARHTTLGCHRAGSTNARLKRNGQWPAA